MNPVYGQSVATRYAPDISGYPVTVQYPQQQEYNRLYAFPVVGFIIKYIILIPHLIMLAVLNWVVMILQFVIWIPVLFTGRYPAWAHQIVGGTLSWTTRVNAFMYGLSDTYPAFSLADPGTGTEAVMLFQPAPTANQLYAVPLLGFLIKSIILIPHFIVLGVLSFVVMLALLVTWIPVLFTGQYPEWGRTLVGGMLRWNVRLYAFWYGLTDAYPPFQLN
jgi:uncharacterized protein DUF4389